MGADEIAGFHEQAVAGDWAKQLQENPIYGHLITDPDNPPEWIIELRAAKLAQIAREGPDALRRSRPRGPIKVSDKQWVKRDNVFKGGIRKNRNQLGLGIMASGDNNNSKTVPKGSQTKDVHQRHMIHLMHRVLSLRTAQSPFTLVLDDLNQRSQPLLTEFIRRGLSRNVNVVLVAYEAKRPQHPAIRCIPAWDARSADDLLKSIKEAMDGFKESLVIVDNLYDLVEVTGVDMNAFFNLVAMEYCSLIIGVYHLDIIPKQAWGQEYKPDPLNTFNYLATTVMKCHSFAHQLAQKAAKERSLPQPTHGLLQGAEGIIQSREANDGRGIVIEAEFRRRSGRPEGDLYFLPESRANVEYNPPKNGMVVGTLVEEFVMLLEQHPTYRDAGVNENIKAIGDEVDAEEFKTTFNLALTEKERLAREGVVLPYHDAQNQQGTSGEGGRILYDMGSEDDFDEEEDEI